MSKKKDIIALALSVSFVMGGASLSHADEINTDTTRYISENQPRETDPSVQNLGNDDKNITEVKNDSEAKEDENLLLSEEKTPGAQQAAGTASQEATGTNYAEDEAKIKDFSAEERYRSTQMEQGKGPLNESSDPSIDFKDGFRYDTLEPGADSPDKKKWGVEIEFDK